MKWITREKFKVDHVPHPWLVKSFVGPQADFILVPAISNANLLSMTRRMRNANGKRRRQKRD